MHPRGTLRVAISGSYGGRNLGDEAILSAVLATLRMAGPVDVTVFSRNPEHTRSWHEVDRALPLGGLSRRDAVTHLEGLDLFVLGGGGILYDGDADLFLREVSLAQELGVPVMVYAVSAGPLTDPGVRSRVKEVLDRAALVTVRDARSQHALEGLAVSQEIRLTADPAVLLPAEPISAAELAHFEAIDFTSRLVAFSVREPGPAAPHLDSEHYHQLLASAADYLVDRFDAEVVFVPLEADNDVRHSHGVVGQMRHAPRATVLKRLYTPGQIVTLLGHFQLAVGMRLHFLLFSALAGTPFLGLPYSEKVAAFLNEFGMCAPPLDATTAGQLIAAVDRAWGERDALKARVAASLDRLQERARTNQRLLLELLAARPAQAGSEAGGGHA